MRIIFFGGTGAIGRRVVNEICKFPKVRRVIIASRKMKSYQKLLKEVESGNSGKGNKLSYLNLDLRRCFNLPEILRSNDVVVGAMGPFYKYEEVLAKASVKARVHYVSICDDHDVVKRVLGLNEAAKKKGVCILTGMGWTPGLSSLLARSGADLLDGVDSIRIYWAGNSSNSMGIAVILHVLHSFTGKVPAVRDGKTSFVRAGSGKERIDFLNPLGKITVYNIGHPEPVTIPCHFPGIKEVTLKGGVNENLLNRIAILAGRSGLSRSYIIRDALALFFQKTLPFWRKIARPMPEVSGITVVVEGDFHGKQCSLTYKAVGPMEVLTGIPMAFAIKGLVSGDIKERGVLSPEAPGMINPSEVFKELESKGVQIEMEKDLL